MRPTIAERPYGVGTLLRLQGSPAVTAAIAASRIERVVTFIRREQMRRFTGLLKKRVVTDRLDSTRRPFIVNDVNEARNSQRQHSQWSVEIVRRRLCWNDLKVIRTPGSIYKETSAITFE